MSTRRLFAAFLAGLVGAGILWAPSGPARAAEDNLFAAMRGTPVVPPAAAPDVAIPALNGGPLRLADLRGKLLIVGFFSTT